MQNIIVITGIMASGKSTVAEALATQLGKAVHLRGDVFRRMIAAGRVEMSDQAGEEALAQLHLRYRLTAQAAKTYAEAGFRVVVQDNYLGKELQNFVDMLKPCTPKMFVLCPSAQAVAQREAGRHKRGYVGFAVEDLHKGFMEETPRIGHWIDSSDQTPQQTVEQILQILRSEAESAQLQSKQ